MPLWQVFHPTGIFTTPQSKQSLATSITKIYTPPHGSLPAFYVVVNFIPLPPSDTFVGGTLRTPEKPFIRFVIDHIAVTLPNEDEAYKRVTKRIDDALKEHVADMGYDWEYHVKETERRLWKINGIAPPAWGSEGEKRWREENRAFSLDE